jgi:RimJ/RimL family protein N-acetyltransferase
MIITGFGVTLTRLQHDDIEMVRQHRNAESVNRFMALRNEISKQDQEAWFSAIDNKFNNYFIITHEDKKIGLIYGANISWEKKETGNGGIFIWDEKSYETHAPLAASMLLTEISFLLGMERTYIKVLRDNPRAISYNHNLGYQILSGQESVSNQQYVLIEKNYYQKTRRFRKLFVKMYGDIFTIFLDQLNHEAEINIREVYFKTEEKHKDRLKLTW